MLSKIQSFLLNFVERFKNVGNIMRSRSKFKSNAVNKAGIIKQIVESRSGFTFEVQWKDS